MKNAPKKDQSPERLDIYKPQKDHHKVDRSIQRYLWAARHAHGRVVDSACGTGYGSYLLAGSAAITHVLGIDRNDDAIGLCNKRYGWCSPRLMFICGEASAFQRADTIVSLETIEHLQEPAQFLDHCRLVLPDRGMLIFSVPLGEKPGANPWHLHTFDLEKVCDMLRPLRFHEHERWIQEHPAIPQVQNLVMRVEAR